MSPSVAPIESVAARVVDGARCAYARWGVRRSSIDDIAREAGLSRATVYRAFPGGREAVAAAVFETELDALRKLVVDSIGNDLEATLTSLLTSIARWFAGHDVIRFMIAHELEVVGPNLAFDGGQRMLAVAADVLAPALEPFLDDDVAGASDWLVRLLKSHLFDPSAHVALADTESVRRLVRTFLLPALAPTSH